MSIEVIEILTKQFAKHRTAVITEAAQMQAEIDEIHKRYAKHVRSAVEDLMSAQEQLTKAIEANQALFPDGQKTRVFDAIKVGYQAGKSTLSGVDDTVTVVKLELLREHAKATNNRECLERIAAALVYQPKMNDAGLRKLNAKEMNEVGIAVLPGAQSVLIKPVDDEAYKAVEATIKTFMAQTKDL